MKDGDIIIDQPGAFARFAETTFGYTPSREGQPAPSAPLGDQPMAKPPATPPGKHLPNDNRPVYLKHLAIHILDKEEEDRLKARKKGNEARATGDGVNVKKMKERLKLIKTKSPSEIAKMFSEDLEAYGHHDIDLSTQPGAQFTIFGGAEAPKKPKGPDFFNVGQLAGLEGKDGNPPRNISQESAQRWQAGWNDGVAYRILGEEHRKQLDSVMDTPAGAQPQPDDASDRDDQTDVEELTKSRELLRVPLSQFGPNAKLEDIELADLEKDEVEAALRIEIYDGENVRVLKETAGPKGSDADDSSPAALKAAGAARAASEKVVPLKKG